MDNKKVLMLISWKDFRDEEYFVPKEYLEKKGVLVETASLFKGMAQGIEGGEALVDVKISEVKVEHYDALIACGGPGMVKLLDNLEFQKVVKDFFVFKKIIASICIAGALLAKSKILKNKKATVWSSEMDKSAIKILEKEGAIYQNSDIVVDGDIITVSGPKVATEFAEEIYKKLIN